MSFMRCTRCTVEGVDGIVVKPRLLMLPLVVEWSLAQRLMLLIEKMLLFGQNRRNTPEIMLLLLIVEMVSCC